MRVRIGLEDRHPDPALPTHYCLNKHLNFLTNSIFPNLYLRDPHIALLHPCTIIASPHHHTTRNDTSKGSLFAFLVPTDLCSRAIATRPNQNLVLTHATRGSGYDTIHAPKLHPWTLHAVTVFIGTSHPYKSSPLFTIPFLPPLASSAFLHTLQSQVHTFSCSVSLCPLPLASSITRFGLFATMATQVASPATFPRFVPISYLPFDIAILFENHLALILLPFS
jgi:hypothetical protein